MKEKRLPINLISDVRWLDIIFELADAEIAESGIEENSESPPGATLEKMKQYVLSQLATETE